MKIALENEVETEFLPEGTEFCEYIIDCNKVCLKDNHYKNCQIRRFYDRYGTKKWHTIKIQNQRE